MVSADGGLGCERLERALDIADDACALPVGPALELRGVRQMHSVEKRAAVERRDVGVTTGRMRRLVLSQSVLSFVFNTTILAFSINAAASFF